MVVQKASTRKKRGKTSIRQKQKVVKQRGKQNVFVQVKTGASKPGKTPQIVYGPGGAGAASSSSSATGGGGFGGPGGGGFGMPVQAPLMQQVPVVQNVPSGQMLPPVVQRPAPPSSIPPPPSPFIRDPRTVPDDDSQSVISSLTDATLVDRSRALTEDMDLASFYPEREQRRPPRIDFGFQGYPGLGAHSDDSSSGRGPDGDAGAAAIRAQLDPFMNEAAQAFQIQRQQLTDLMQRSEQARVDQEVANRTFLDQQTAFMQESRGLQERALRDYMQTQLTDLAQQARGLFAQLEAEMQTNFRASSDRVLETQQQALRQDYNAFLEKVDEYRRDRPDAGDGGAALLSQVTQANAQLQALQNRMQGVLSREEALREIAQERDSLRGQVQAVQADIQRANQQRMQEIQAVQDNVRALRQEMQAAGQNIPAEIQSTLTRISGELGDRTGDMQRLAGDLSRLRAQVGTIPTEASRQLGVAVQSLQSSIGEVQRDLIGRLGASEQRLEGIVNDEIDATRLSMQAGMQEDLGRLRDELSSRQDQQSQALVAGIQELQQGLQDTNVSGNALARQVEQVQEQLANTVSRDDSNTQIQRLSQAVVEELGSVQQNIMSEQDRRVRDMVEPLRASMNVLAEGSRRQQQVTADILTRMQAQQVNPFDAGAFPGDSYDAAQGMISMGGRMGTEQAFGDMAQMGAAQGLMQMSQQAPPAPPTSSTMQDYMSILAAGPGPAEPPPPPPLPMTRLMTGPPDVMDRGLDDSQTSMVIDAFDPMQFTPFGGADTVR
jgi:uncharacterized coiled-coil DUF342 family protein